MPTKNTKKVKQEIVIVIDKSGSMSSSRDDVIGGFNTYIADLKKDEETDVKLTLVMFDTYVHKLHSGKALKDISELSAQTYCPGGSTALNDAVMEAVEDVEARLKKSKAKDDPQVMVVVFTDGEENASRKFKKDAVSDKRKEKEAEGWAFIFMGADMDAWAAGSSYGMSAGNTISLGKQAIGDSMAFLSNRTKKASKAYAARGIGGMSQEVYTRTMSNLMTLDADDLANDAEAVNLRATIDNSSKVSNPNSKFGYKTLSDKIKELKAEEIEPNKHPLADYLADKLNVFENIDKTP